MVFRFECTHCASSSLFCALINEIYIYFFNYYRLPKILSRIKTNTPNCGACRARRGARSCTRVRRPTPACRGRTRGSPPGPPPRWSECGRLRNEPSDLRRTRDLNFTAIVNLI